MQLLMPGITIPYRWSCKTGCLFRILCLKLPDSQKLSFIFVFWQSLVVQNFRNEFMIWKVLSVNPTSQHDPCWVINSSQESSKGTWRLRPSFSPQWDKLSWGLESGGNPSYLMFSLENGNGLGDVLGPVFVDKCLCNAALPWIPSACLPTAPPAQTR